MATKKGMFWTAFILFVILTGCGYRFVGGGSFPSGIESVFVEIFQNRSAEVGLENTITNDLIYEITRKEAVFLESKDNAEGILSGVVTDVTTAPASRRGETVAVERRITVRLDLKLTNTNGKVVWTVKGISANETYFVGALNEVTEANKQEALEVLSKRFSEIMYTQLTSDF